MTPKTKKKVVLKLKKNENRICLLHKLAVKRRGRTEDELKINIRFILKSRNVPSLSSGKTKT